MDKNLNLKEDINLNTVSQDFFNLQIKTYKNIANNFDKDQKRDNRNHLNKIKAINKFLKIENDEKVLEIGIGTGIHAKYLLEFNQNKVFDFYGDVGCSQGYILKTIAPFINKGKGVDISKTIIQLNNKNNHLANISFDVFDGRILTLSEKYNKVLLIDVLEHAFYPDELIVTIKDTMVLDGLCVIGVPFSGFLSELIFGKYHQGHLRYYDPDYLSNYIEKFGFEIVKVKIHNSVPWSSRLIKVPFLYNLLDFLVNLIPSKIYPYFGEILVLAKNEK